jgi:hypothetical protein
MRSESLALRAEFIEWCGNETYINALLAMIYLESVADGNLLQIKT